MKGRKTLLDERSTGLIYGGLLIKIRLLYWMINIKECRLSFVFPFIKTAKTCDNSVKLNPPMTTIVFQIYPVRFTLHWNTNRKTVAFKNTCLPRGPGPSGCQGEPCQRSNMRVHTCSPPSFMGVDQHPGEYTPLFCMKTLHSLPSLRPLSL